MRVTPELLDELAAWQNFSPHFHLPLQSGAAPILAAMGRPYARKSSGTWSGRSPGAFPAPA